jgi:hypothetical protein
VREWQPTPSIPSGSCTHAQAGVRRCKTVPPHNQNVTDNPSLSAECQATEKSAPRPIRRHTLPVLRLRAAALHTQVSRRCTRLFALTTSRHTPHASAGWIAGRYCHHHTCHVPPWCGIPSWSSEFQGVKGKIHHHTFLQLVRRHSPSRVFYSRPFEKVFYRK